jgi:hypothetical protein
MTDNLTQYAPSRPGNVSRMGLPIPRAPNGPRGFRAVPAAERFSDRYFSEPNCGCWLWLGALNDKGYACFESEHGQTGHRFAYIHFIGPVLEGLVLDHKCRTRSCVNPWHLEAVTNLENIRRGVVGINSRSKTHCPKGHDYNAENTAVRCGKRQCRTCENARSLRNHYKRRAAKLALIGAA